MTTTLPNSAPPKSANHHDGPSVRVIRQKIRMQKLRAAMTLANRVKTMPDGSRAIARFSTAQRLEHQILIISFGLLALTGLLQRYSQYEAVAFIIEFFGNIDALRVIHHLAAVLMIVQSVYHIFTILNVWFVNKERGHMWPSLKDLTDLLSMVKFNLRISQKRPEFDRFSAEEKLEYWALLWGTPLMILTGAMMWFPIQTTAFLPGYAIPIARALHGWEAVLATLAILTWHMYHTVIKEQNKSIFTGLMSEADMKHEHPLEYRRIMAAYEFIQKQTADDDQNHHSSQDQQTNNASVRLKIPEKVV